MSGDKAASYIQSEHPLVKGDAELEGLVKLNKRARSNRVNAKRIGIEKRRAAAQQAPRLDVLTLEKFRCSGRKQEVQKNARL